MARAKRWVPVSGLLAAVAVAMLLLLQVIALRLIATADVDGVSFAGRQVNSSCIFQQSFGVPCPTCGITRSVIMAAHGDYYAAWQMNPAGLLAVAGAMMFSGAMLWVTFTRRLQLSVTTQRIKFWTLLYAGGLVAVLLLHWLRKMIAS